MSDDDYNYLFYKETLINSEKSTSEDITGKNLLWFQDPFQTYTRRIAPPLVLSPASYQVLHYSQVRISLLNYLILLLMIIFSLHIEKKKTYLYSTFSLKFCFLFSFINFFSFFHCILVLTLDSQECIGSTIYFKSELRGAGGDDGLRAECDLRVCHTSTKKESH